MLRGVLVPAIYHKTTQMGIGDFDDAAAVILMSADTEPFVPEMISPVVTFAIFLNIANQNSGTLASSVVYTSISTLMLETQLLTQLFQVIPQLEAAVGSFGRISNFLDRQSSVDKREKFNSKITARSENLMGGTDDISRETKPSDAFNLPMPLANEIGIKIQGELPKPQLTIVIGPVASGKSTLCNVILGEMAFSKGIIQLSSSQIALCDQTPFLTNTTLRENIVGSSVFEDLWYHRVIDAVSLNAMYLAVYSIFQLLGLLSITLLAQHGLNRMAKKSGKNLHSRLLKTAMSAPLNFFHTTDAGSITNRFSQDILLIDTEPPNALMNIAALIFMVTRQAIIIAVASPYLATWYPIVIGILYFIQKFYLRTSRQLRLLELETKSPLYTHFLDTLRGLRTIRAFNWTATNQELNSKLLDTSQRPVYLLFMVPQWLAVVLNLVMTAIVIILVSVATVTRSQNS
ncbi:hypothetical protein DSL72_003505 [Monilinia vaccinii-corymbosi]|uniref:ABC transmembrane type-1 domain-containing protein n=1 Tax=Monilinia vaccinii-corymbosi TaxID=61207 RepID=A0A8A3P1E5_9HELO|nr:hypothetical protein DSL72_003505 [Monilinia vaccinii-corymbosi]